jgi:hypothetical protein
LFFRGLVVNALQIRRFTAQTGTVIDDFAIDLAGGEIDETQKSPQLSVARRLEEGAPRVGMSDYHLRLSYAEAQGYNISTN